MTRPHKKRKKRTARVSPCLVKYEAGWIVLTEWRNGVEHVTRIDMREGATYMAEHIHEACVEHVKAVRADRAAHWNSANNACRRMGVSE